MAGKIATPSELPFPAFLMNFPFTVDNRVANNALMINRTPYDYPLAFGQWMDLYNTLAKESLVCLLPHLCEEFQDLPFVANLAAVLPHNGAVVLANFKSEPRQGEEVVGDRFLLSMGYQVPRSCPEYFEGEADLKFIRDNLYIGGYGIRTDLATYRWMMDAFDMRIVPVAMTDRKLYHFNCLFFPIDGRRALVATSAIDKMDVKAIEEHVEIIDVPKRFIYDGWTNAVRLNRKILAAIPSTTESRNALESQIVQLGFDPMLINLDEFEKSGAGCSCLVMHLNFNGRQ